MKLLQSLGKSRELLRRIPASWNGIRGAFILCMMLTAVAFGLVRLALMSKDPATRAEAELNDLLQKKQEPGRPVAFQMLASALVGKGADWTICDVEPGTNGLVPDAAFKLFNSRYWGLPDDNEARTTLADTLQNPDWYPSSVVAIPRLAPYFEEHFPTPDLTPSGGHLTVDTTNQFSNLRIPSLLAPALESENPIGQRIKDAARRSLALRSLTDLIGKSVTKSSAVADDLPTFKAFYFISLDGVLRIVPGIQADLDAHRLFNSPTYFAETLAVRERPECHSNTLRRYDSRPYLDLNGNGLVSTLCYRVKKDKGGLVAGIFCEDMGLPRKNIYEPLAHSNLFSVRLVRAETSHGSATLTSPPVVCDTAGFPCPNQSFHPDDSDIPEIKKAAQQWWEQYRTKGQISGAAEVAILKKNKYTYAAAVVGDMYNEKKVYEVAILRLLPHPFDGWLYLVGATLCTIGVIVLIALMRLRQDRERESVLLRGLKLGVLRLDSNQVIVGANACAEALLNHKLPRLGLGGKLPWKPWGAKNAVKFTDFIKTDPIKGEQVRIRERVKSPDGKFEFKFKWSSFGDILNLRRAGLTSEYWVKVSPAERNPFWIRIIGSPLLCPDGSQDTFGTFECVTPDIERQLENASL